MRVERIQALHRLYERRGRGPVVTFLGYARPLEVTSTWQRLFTSASDHTFFIDVRPL